MAILAPEAANLTPKMANLVPKTADLGGRMANLARPGASCSDLDRSERPQSDFGTNLGRFSDDFRSFAHAIFAVFSVCACVCLLVRSFVRCRFSDDFRSLSSAIFDVFSVCACACLFVRVVQLHSRDKRTMHTSATHAAPGPVHLTTASTPHDAAHKRAQHSLPQGKCT